MSHSKKHNECGTELKSGFTLVEIIVALGIFSIVATVALGALVRIISANKKAQTLQSAITNLNFSLDSMSRELRVGSAFYCVPEGESYTYTPGNELVSQGCSLGNHAAIFFKSSRRSGSGTEACRLVHAYKFDLIGPDSYQLSKAAQRNCSEGIDESSFTPLVPSNVVIDNYELGVLSDGEHTYPMAVIRLSGYVGVRASEKTFFDIQTAVSSRIP